MKETLELIRDMLNELTDSLIIRYKEDNDIKLAIDVGHALGTSLAIIKIINAELDEEEQK